jgi:hypothetical protein
MPTGLIGFSFAKAFAIAEYFCEPGIDLPGPSSLFQTAQLVVIKKINL